MRNEFLVTLMIALAAGCNAQLRDADQVDADIRDGGPYSADGGSTDAAPADGGARLDAGPSAPSCAGRGECTLTSRTCCGVCAAPVVGDVVAVRWDRAEEYRNGVCGGSGPVPCPACASMENPHLSATCRAGACTAIDVRTDETSACSTDADCMLRYGTGCCEPCGTDSTSRLTAFRKDALAAVVRCLPNEGACPPCVPTYPSNARAACNAQTKHCEVILSP